MDQVESLDLPAGAAYIVLKSVPGGNGFKCMLFDLLDKEDEYLGVITRGLIELVDNNTNVVMAVGLAASINDKAIIENDAGTDEYITAENEDK